MYAQPAPPVQKKPTPWGLIILILLGGFLVVVGLCAFGGYYAFKQISQDPKPKQGFGNPTVLAKLPDGWTRFRFQEVPFSIELPEKPTANKLSFEPGDSLFTKAWIYYSCVSDLNGIEIVGHWYPSDEVPTIEEELDYIDWFVESTQETSTANSNSKEVVLGKIKGHKAEGSFTSDGQKMGFFCFLWTRDKCSFNVFCYYYPETKDKAEAEFHRIVTSIQEG